MAHTRLSKIGESSGSQGDRPIGGLHRFKRLNKKRLEEQYREALSSGSDAASSQMQRKKRSLNVISTTPDKYPAELNFSMASPEGQQAVKTIIESSRSVRRGEKNLDSNDRIGSTDLSKTTDDVAEDKVGPQQHRITLVADGIGDKHLLTEHISDNTVADNGRHKRSEEDKEDNDSVHQTTSQSVEQKDIVETSSRRKSSRRDLTRVVNDLVNSHTLSQLPPTREIQEVLLHAEPVLVGLSFERRQSSSASPVVSNNLKSGTKNDFTVTSKIDLIPLSTNRSVSETNNVSNDPNRRQSQPTDPLSLNRAEKCNSQLEMSYARVADSDPCSSSDVVCSSRRRSARSKKFISSVNGEPRENNSDMNIIEQWSSTLNDANKIKGILEHSSLKLSSVGSGGTEGVSQQQQEQTGGYEADYTSGGSEISSKSRRSKNSVMDGMQQKQESRIAENCEVLTSDNALMSNLKISEISSPKKNSRRRSARSSRTVSPHSVEKERKTSQTDSDKDIFVMKEGSLETAKEFREINETNEVKKVSEVDEVGVTRNRAGKRNSVMPPEAEKEGKTSSTVNKIVLTKNGSERKKNAGNDSLAISVCDHDDIPMKRSRDDETENKRSLRKTYGENIKSQGNTDQYCLLSVQAENYQEHLSSNSRHNNIIDDGRIFHNSIAERNQDTSARKKLSRINCDDAYVDSNICNASNNDAITVNSFDTESHFATLASMEKSRATATIPKRFAQWISAVDPNAISSTGDCNSNDGTGESSTKKTQISTERVDHLSNAYEASKSFKQLSKTEADNFAVKEKADNQRTTGLMGATLPDNSLRHRGAEKSANKEDDSGNQLLSFSAEMLTIETRDENNREKERKSLSSKERDEDTSDDEINEVNETEAVSLEKYSNVNIHVRDTNTSKHTLDSNFTRNASNRKSVASNLSSVDLSKAEERQVRDLVQDSPARNSLDDQDLANNQVHDIPIEIFAGESPLTNALVKSSTARKNNSKRTKYTNSNDRSPEQGDRKRSFEEDDDEIGQVIQDSDVEGDESNDEEECLSEVQVREGNENRRQDHVTDEHRKRIDKVERVHGKKRMLGGGRDEVSLGHVELTGDEKCVKVAQGNEEKKKKLVFTMKLPPNWKPVLPPLRDMQSSVVVNHPVYALGSDKPSSTIAGTSKENAAVSLHPKLSQDGQYKPLKGNIQKLKPGSVSRVAKNPRVKRNPGRIPTTLTRNALQFFGGKEGITFSKDALEAVECLADTFWDNALDELQEYASHAGRAVVNRSDMELLMWRQRVISDDMPLECLITDYLPGEYRAELIPIARSGNKIETTRCSL